MGRPPYPRDEHGNIVRPDDPRFEQLGGKRPHANTSKQRHLTDTGRYVLRGAGGRFAKRGDTSDRGPDPGPEQSSTDRAEEIGVHVSRQEEIDPGPIHVEPQPAKPPRDEKPPARAKVTTPGPFKADHFTAIVVAGFGAVANLTNRKHVAVHDPKVEVEPWTPACATLANKYVKDAESAEKLQDGFAALQIVMGLGSMIGARVQWEAEERAHREERRLFDQRARAGQLRREEGLDPDSPAAPEAQTSPNGATTARGSGGAMSTHPGKIAGLGDTPQGL